MIFRNGFTLSLPPEEAFRVLLDVPRMAACLPGATLEETVNGVHRGSAAVRVGPLNLVFRGEAVLENVDAANRTAVFRGRGADQKGRGNAQAVFTFAVTGEQTGSRVEVTTDLTLSGAVAQYGRAQGVIQAVMQQIVDAFVANLEATVRHRAAPEASGAPLGSSPAALSAFSLAWAVIRAFFRRARDASKTFVSGARPR